MIFTSSDNKTIANLNHVFVLDKTQGHMADKRWDGKN